MINEIKINNILVMFLTILIYTHTQNLTNFKTKTNVSIIILTGKSSLAEYTFFRYEVLGCDII